MNTRFAYTLAVSLAFCFWAVPASVAVDVDVTSDPFNAVPDDGVNDGWAFRNALQYIADNGGGTLNVPPGTYQFTERHSVDLNGTTVTIQGAGMDVTNISGDNGNGILYFNNTDANSQLIVYDITFLATRASSGCALRFDNTALPTISISNLSVERVDFKAEQDANYFNRGIYARYVKNAVFRHVSYTDPDDSHLAESGFHIDHGNSAEFDNCSSSGSQTGFDLAAMEGTVTFMRCLVLFHAAGLNIQCTAGTGTTVNVYDCHSNCSSTGTTLRTGVTIANAQNANICNHMSYPYQGNYNDFTIDSCKNVLVQGCQFMYGVNLYGTTYTRTATYLGGTTGANGSVTIKNNIYNYVTDPYRGSANGGAFLCKDNIVRNSPGFFGDW